MLKIRSTRTDGEQNAQMREWVPEKEYMTFQAPAVPNERRNLMVKSFFARWSHTATFIIRSSRI